MIEITPKNRKIMSMILKFTSIKKKDGTFLGKNSNIYAPTKIDSGTRINGKIVIKGDGKCMIGKYCALGDGIRIITSNHNIHFLNLQAALQKQILPVDFSGEKKDVSIGHNVWVGDNAIILAGVQIGNGSVIGAGAVVTKDVPAFSVVGGVPAKVLKFRFKKEVMDKIKAIKWWDWSYDKMKENRELFNGKINIEKLKGIQ